MARACAVLTAVDILLQMLNAQSHRKGLGLHGQSDGLQILVGDIFHDAHPYTNWRVGVEHAAKLGMGSTEYELIEV